jgi:hypothetical protein
VLEFKDINLTAEKPLDPAVKKVKEMVLTHPKFTPYAFKIVMKKDAVKLEGFTIVISKSATAVEQFAAQELASYLHKVTGRELPIAATAPDAARTINLVVKPGSPEDAFSSEFTDGKKMTITGNSPRALVFAVYDFLEKAAGIRWFAPFPYGEVIPSNPNLCLPLFKDDNAPLMTYRRSHYCSNKLAEKADRHRYDMADWTFKNRYNVELERLSDPARIMEFYRIRGEVVRLPQYLGHNFHKLIPPSQYLKSEPDFFCFDQATGKWRAERAQLCTTNPKLIQTLAGVAEEFFRNNPDQTYFPLFQEDGSRLWCQCPACLALNPSGSNLGSASENNINLANLVCAEIRKKHPDKGVITYAYSVTSKPPVKIMPQPGVRITYCYYSDGCPEKLPWDVENGQTTMRWSELTGGNMLVYSYHYLNPRYAFNNENTLIQMFRFFQVLNIQGSNQECGETWGGIDPYLMYLGGRLAWNPWFDEDVLKNDYFQKFYGHASQAMRHFHDLLSDTLSNKSKWLRHGLNSYPSIPSAELAQLTSDIEQAKRFADNDSRVLKAVQAQADYLKFLKVYSTAMKTGDLYYRHPSVDGYRAALASIQELRKITEEMVPPRLVSLSIVRLYDAWQRGLENAWRENMIFQDIGNQYDILESLNPWKFYTDPKAQGDEGRWYATDFNDAAWKDIKSGQFWEEQGFSDYDGIAWYRIALKIPKSDQAFALYFGGADERAWVYLDGKYLGGHHEGDVGKLCNESFVIKLPAGLKSGTHQLTVKVIDSAGKGGLWKEVYLLKKK